jgi:branched-chain amino acid transport system substrate-binding protein
MQRHERLRLALALTLGLAACDNKDAQATRTTSQTTPRTSSGPVATPTGIPQTPTTGVTETEVTLGEPAAFTGPSAGLGIEMWRGASAAFSEINEKGGVAGRKIKLAVADDAYEAERAAPAVIRLVEQERAFLIFGGVGTPTIVRALPVVRKYFDEAGLFYFASFTGAQPQRRPPNFQIAFNVRASYYEETKAIVDVFVAMDKKKVGVFIQDDAYGIDGREGAVRALKSHGLELAGEARYPRGQKYDVSDAAQVKILRDAGADAVVMVGSYQACGAFVRDARRSGWGVPIHNVSFVGADQMLELLQNEEKKGGEKVTVNLVNTQVVPHYDDMSVPVVRDYRAALDKYNPTAPAGFAASGYDPATKYSFGSLEGYVSARALLAILAKAGHELTRKSAYAAAEAMGQFDLGLGVPAELSPARHQALDKVWFTYATPAGWKPTDKPAAVLK